MVHVVRATGRRDRHSKVYTSRGPRDRRVRLSAVTAIQFYDVQDRLGYERPSEAVDWLIQKAKASIEALPKKPNVDPCSIGVTFTSFAQNLMQDTGNVVECAMETGLKEEPLGVESINIAPSFAMDGSLSLLSGDYVHMENSMSEFSYELGNDISDPSLGARSNEYLMLQEEPSLWLDQVVLNPCHFQKIVSSNHKFSSRTANHMFPGTGPAFHESTKPCVPMKFQPGKE